MQFSTLLDNVLDDGVTDGAAVSETTDQKFESSEVASVLEFFAR
jgi:hypothetical protein